MTTIDSDSESQDSDDGRRFRFEATRKDDILTLPSHNKKTLQASRSDVGSRSNDSGQHNRKNNDKGRLERERKETNNHNKKRDSKERDSKDRHDKESRGTSKSSSKESVEPKLEVEKRSADLKNSNQRDGKDSLKSKDYRNSKDSRCRDSKTDTVRTSKDSKLRETKDSRENEQRNLKDRESLVKNCWEKETKNSKDSESKDHRERERELKRSRDPSREKISAATVKHRNRSREKYVKNRAQEGRSHDKSDSRDVKRISDTEKLPRDERAKVFVTKTRVRKRKRTTELKRVTRSPSKILDQIGSDSESDLGALDPDVGPVISLDALEDCTEMNLSDFDVVSDTDGSSSESSHVQPPVKGPIIKGAILQPHYYEPKIKKRVSRRQYERLLKRQAAATKRHLKLCKVNERNSAEPLGPSDNNPSAVSDFLLGPESASVSSIVERRGSRKTGDEKGNEDGKYVSSATSKSDTDFYEQCDDQESSLSLKKKCRNELKNLNPQPEISTDSEYNNDTTDNKDSGVYGPMLPPKDQTPQVSYTELNSRAVTSDNLEKISPFVCENVYNRDSSDSTSDDFVGPRIPAMTEECRSMTNVIGPTPPKIIQETSHSTCDVSPRVCGPVLPPNMTTTIKDSGSEPQESLTVLGPSLPPHLRKQKNNSELLENDDNPTKGHENHRVLGPELPEHIKTMLVQGNFNSSDSDDGDVVGPMPANHPAILDNYVQRQLEERANRMKNKLTSENTCVEKREEWMLELPSVQQAASLGLSARQFRSKAGPDMSDRSSWTDSPADKVRKREEKLAGKTKAVDHAKELERLAIEKRDRTMEEMVEKHQSKKQQESLLELHQKKLQKKKKKEEKKAKEAVKPARRPFDRDVDLQVNRFDEAQKKAILKKAQLLNDRFSRGESKYL